MYILFLENTYFLIQYIKIKILLMKLTKEQILGIVRHGLTFIGGILIMKGLVDEATATEIIGGVITLAGTIWSVIEKK
jgi:hypothetical protein